MTGIDVADDLGLTLGSVGSLSEDQNAGLLMGKRVRGGWDEEVLGDDSLDQKKKI